MAGCCRRRARRMLDDDACPVPCPHKPRSRRRISARLFPEKLTMLVRMMSSSGVMRGCRLLATLFLGALGISAWVSPAASAAAEPMPVVASFSVLGDMVAEIGGDHVKLTTIIGLGGDAHSFEPTPEHVRALSEARVLVVNGLGFEAWLPRLLAASNFQGQQVVASRGIEPRRLLASHAADA